MKLIVVMDNLVNSNNHQDERQRRKKLIHHRLVHVWRSRNFQRERKVG